LTERHQPEAWSVLMETTDGYVVSTVAARDSK
jgi:hypothetical protein